MRKLAVESVGDRRVRGGDGKITGRFDSSTPRLYKKFNYRIKWFDGWENHKLILENYDHGPTAPYNSWCLLQRPGEGTFAEVPPAHYGIR